MPRSHPVSPRMPVGLQVQLTLACLPFCVTVPNTHNNTVEMVSVFCVWSNCRYLEPWMGVTTGHPFFIPILDRVSAEIQNKPPSDWERLVPPLLVTQHLLSCRLHLCICPGLDTQKHTHKHSQHKHMCVYTHAWHGDTNANRECRCFRS
uniref:Secreted protein n=1 Tax=Bos taurus TaxID=9913 RepID=A0ABI0NUL7_BOVIN